MTLSEQVNAEIARLKNDSIPPEKWLITIIRKIPEADRNFVLEMIMIETGGDNIEEPQ